MDHWPDRTVHEVDFGSDRVGPAAAAPLKQRVLSLAWWLARRVPWYLWLMLALFLYGRYVQGNGKRVTRARRRPAPTPAQNPRRYDPPKRDVIAGRPSPLSISRTSPNLERRGSYGRYGAGYGSPAQSSTMTERRNSGLSAYSPLASPRPVVTPPPYSVSSHVDSPARAPSSLRNEFTASAPVLPTTSSLSRRAPLKRAHSDEALPATSGEKRTKVGGDYDFAHDGGEEDAPMELDEEALVREPPAPRGTTRRRPDDDEDEEDEASKRSRTLEPSASEGGEAAAQPEKGKKRRASDGSLSSEGLEQRDTGAVKQQKKKARKGALGTGSGRDKRSLADTSFERTEDEDALELDEDEEGRAPTKNADSDYSETDEAAQLPQPVDKGKGKEKPAPVKRFRSRLERRGSDDDDMMGDDLPQYGSSTPSSSTPASPAAKSPPPSSTSGFRGNPRLGRIIAKQQQQARRASGLNSRQRSPSPQGRELELVSPDTPRKPGDEWVNHEGDRYKIELDGTQKRLCEVRERRLKYRMPKDSRHPDAKATHVVIVERWLTNEQYQQAFEHRKLAWQTTFEEETRQLRAQEAAEVEERKAQQGDAVPGDALGEEDLRSDFYIRGAGTPLRTYRNINEILARPGSSSGASTPTRQSPMLANGRMRLGGGQVARNSPRKWSDYEVRKLLEDEETARAERERRRKAYLAMGGDLYPTDYDLSEEDRIKAAKDKEEKDKEPAKLKLADYAIAAPPVVAAAPEEKKKDEVKAPASSFTAPSASSATAATTSATSGTSTSTATAKPSVPNFFGGAGSKSAVAPATETKQPAAPSFSFGAPTPASEKKDEAPAAPKPSFSFGAPAANPDTAPKGDATAAPKPSFSFATETKKDGTPNAPFSFGSPAAPVDKKVDTAAAALKPLFGFGASTSSPALDKPAAEAPKPASFSFGAAPAAPAAVSVSTPAPAAAAPSPFGFSAPTAPAASEPPKADKPSFSFGAPAAPSATSAPGSAASFSFGAPAKPEEPKPTTPAASPFSFGAAAPTSQTSSTGAAPAAASPFSFGGAGSAPSASAAPATTGFGFGQSTSAAATPTAPAASAAPAATGFSFGASAPAQPASTGFSFGQASVSPAPASPAPATGGFSFGGGFTFGEAAAPSGTPGGTPMFSQTSTSQAPASTDLSSEPAASPTTSGSVTGTESVPFYSAPNTFTPTASGVSPAPGSVVTIVNTAGAGSYTDTFVYTAAASTVPPTGNITNTAVPARSGGAGGVTDLSPNPTHLQVRIERELF
ncbi:hypothetical protein Rhopal_001236-T1 [Rhodotorula paludigena]|uniref:Uncharacterized protein n=1 Tax=Rhodotorula paludigena TaxID=86838 RepID=A0AAV5GF53_9BASI|nr:hypothetical protein Rhopal_001236-T1 [Rhodotorula paludigena]